MYYRKDLTKERLYTACEDTTGRVMTMDGKTERLYILLYIIIITIRIRIKKKAIKLDLNKQRQLVFTCKDGSILTIDPESGNVTNTVNTVVSGTLNAYQTCAHLMYYTTNEDNLVHVLDMKNDRVYIFIVIFIIEIKII